ncbi:MAG: TetR/AcrR family transcriptional regulator [Endozoicomonas sp.]
MSEHTKPTRKDGLATKQSLIDAAERLFAEQGIDNVKLVDVSRAAGQKNRTAAQYHFVDRSGLIHAVLDKHSVHIARQRKKLLEELDQSAPIGKLVEVLVMPVVQHIRNDPNGLTYLYLNRQLVSSSNHLELGRERSSRMPEVLELQRRMRAAIPDQNEAVIHTKMILVHCMLFNGLANFYDLSPAGAISVFVDTLCASIEAVLMQAT